MTVEVRSTSTGPASPPAGSGAFTLPRPAGASPGDLLVAILYQPSNATLADLNVTSPQWVSVGDSSTIGSWVGNGEVFAHTVGQLEPDNYTFSTTTNTSVVGSIICFTAGSTSTEFFPAWDFSVNKDGKINTTSLTQGQANWGVEYSRVGFDWTTIHATIGTNTVQKVEFYKKNEHFHYSSGGEIILGTHTQVNEPSIGAKTGDLPDRWRFHFDRYSERWLTLPLSLWDEMKSTGTVRGFMLGFTNFGDLAHYGYFRGFDALRITHTSNNKGVKLDTGLVWGNSVANSTSHVAPSFVPLSSEVLELCAYMSLAGGAAHSYTPPGGMTERTDHQSTGLDLTLSTGTELRTLYQELSTNPRFVTDTAGWGSHETNSGTHTITRLTGQTVTGSSTTTVCRLTNTSGATQNQLVVFNPLVASPPAGATVTFSCKVRRPTNGGDVQVFFDFFNSSDVFISGTSASVTTTAGLWHDLVGSSVAPAGTAKTRVCIGRQGIGAGLSIDFTDVSWRRLVNTRTATSTRSTGYLTTSLGVAETPGPHFIGTGETSLTLGTSSTGTPFFFGSGAAVLFLGTSSTGSEGRSGTGTTGLQLGQSAFSYKLSEGEPRTDLRLGTYSIGFNPMPSTYTVTRREPPTPLPKIGKRYIVQNALSREILNWDLPILDDQVTQTLSGPCEITGTLKPEIAREVTSGANKILEPWGTLIHCEENGKIVATGLLQPSTLDQHEWSIKAEGFSGYPHGIPYDGEYSKTEVDPIDVVKEIWRFIQAYPSGALGVSVTGATKSEVKLGIEKEKPDDPASALKPYTLSWWDNKDSGSEIDSLAKSSPFEYREVSKWNSDLTDVDLCFDIASPRHGRYKDALRFMQGENILESVQITEPDDWYADVVIGLGSGEGREIVHEKTPAHFHGVIPRLRRVHTYSNKRITDKAELKRLIEDEVNRRLVVHEIASIVVDGRHPNAELGTFECGDDILVQAEVPWIGMVSLKHRITKFTHDRVTDQVKIDLTRSDAFRYGRENPVDTQGG
jgi:hypothetical protein